MLYQFFEWNHAAIAPWRAIADATKAIYQNPLNPMSRTDLGRSFAAMAELFERSTRAYAKPEFGIHQTSVNGLSVPVVDRIVWQKPFARLLHFERALPPGRAPGPRFLLVAPMSGHYATLLRGTVEALLPYADVYITDWEDARKVPVAQGRFDLDDYVDYLIEMLHFLGPDTHVIGVCQPAVPVMMAVAAMSAKDDDCVPATMTLMGGPIDTRVNPTEVNKLATDRGIGWFRDHVIMKVPFPQPGMMRDVYPGFLQLSGFMSMNLDRHLIAQKDFFWHLVKNDGDSAEKHRAFYDEYNAVMDLTAEFYLQTVEEVFVKHSLPKGEITHRGERLDMGRISRTALLTVEGENDDISGNGQTKAAHDLCTAIPEDMRVHYMQPKVGHYGVFNGSRFRAEIAPRIVDFALTHGRKGKPAAGPQVTGAEIEAATADKPSTQELTDSAPVAVESDSLAAPLVLAGEAAAPAVEAPRAEPVPAPVPAPVPEKPIEQPSAMAAGSNETARLVAPASEGSASAAVKVRAPRAARPMPDAEASPVAAPAIVKAPAVIKPAKAQAAKGEAPKVQAAKGQAVKAAPVVPTKAKAVNGSAETPPAMPGKPSRHARRAAKAVERAKH